MGETIRILHVLGRLDRGGAETMVLNLYRNIDRSKVQFDFLIHTKEKCDYTEEIESMGGKIYSVPRFNFRNIIAYKQAWLKFFKEHKEYKIIHGHVRSTASIYLKIAKKEGLITISHSHSTSSGNGLSAIVKNILQYPIRRTADYLFACSMSAGKWLFGERACKQKNFFIINNSIDTKAFIFDDNDRKSVRDELSIGSKFVLGHVGRFNYAKNHSLLIDIFKEVNDKDKDTCLILVGAGELRDEIESKVEELNLYGNVIFTGTSGEVYKFFNTMDVFVFPSLFEGLGMAVVEAQASGLPCVVSDKIPKEAFITDLIEVTPLDSPLEDWAKKILMYKNNVDKRKNTHSEVKSSGYDIIETTKWIESFYLKVIKTNQ